MWLPSPSSSRLTQRTKGSFFPCSDGAQRPTRRGEMLKLLSFFHFLPYPPNEGSTIYTYHHLEQLRTRHDVVVFAPMRKSTDEESVAALRDLGWKIETVHKPNVSRAKAVWSRIRAVPSPYPVHWVLSWDDVIGRELERLSLVKRGVRPSATTIGR